MNILTIFSTDMWQTDSNFIGVVDSIENAIAMIRRNDDLMCMIQNQDGHVVIDQYTLNQDDSEIRITGTYDEDFIKQLSEPLPEGVVYIEEYGSYYFLKEKTIFCCAAYENNLFTKHQIDNDSCEVSACPEGDLPFVNQEVQFMERIMIAFDLNAIEVLELEPIKSFTAESIDQFRKEYI